VPWHIGKSSRCPASRPWAVITNSTGRPAGCHPTKAAAQAQLAALNAQGASAQDGKAQEAPMTETAAPEMAPTDNLYRAISPSPELLILRAATAADGDEAATAAAMPVMTTDFIVFRSWTEIDSFLEGRFMEQIDPGAVARTFKEDRSRMRVLFQHGRDPQIGDKPLGPIDTLEANGRSATAEVPLLDTAYNRELIPGLAAGLYGASFRFRVLGESWNKKPARSKHNPEGLPERTITEIEVREFGPVTFPAYDSATAGLRSSDASSDASSDSDGVLPARMLMRSVTDDFLAPADVPAAIIRAGFDPARVAAWATGATSNTAGESSFSGRPSPRRAGGGDPGTEPDQQHPGPETDSGASTPDGDPPAREPAPPGPGSRRARARDRALRLRGVL
jgi:phage head maturation protease